MGPGASTWAEENQEHQQSAEAVWIEKYVVLESALCFFVNDSEF